VLCREGRVLKTYGRPLCALRLTPAVKEEELVEVLQRQPLRVVLPPRVGQARPHHLHDTQRPQPFSCSTTTRGIR
jgi:hypothetical protein